MGKILLIDDDSAFLKVLEEYVEERYPGLQVLTCDDPLRCLIAITNDLDLLLVDLEMPGLDGGKVLFSVDRTWMLSSAIPLFLLSGLPQLRPEAAHKAYPKNADM